MSGNIHVDARLRTIMGMIPAGSAVADIGCDHGYLLCALAEAGLIKHGFACDANLKPLEQAKKNIVENCLTNTIDTVLTNGLTGLPHQEIDVFVIAGMGGELIADIFLEHAWTRDKNLQFIFQPMTKPEKLRKAIYENGFTIAFEQAVISDSKLYTVMSVIYTGLISDYDEVSFYTGMLIKNSDSASRQFLTQTLRRIEKKARGLAASSGPQKSKKYADLADKIRERIKVVGQHDI